MENNHFFTKFCEGKLCPWWYKWLRKIFKKKIQSIDIGQKIISNARLRNVIGANMKEQTSSSKTTN